MLQKSLHFFIKSFLLLLPFQSIWIYDEIFLNGVKSQWGVSGFYATEIMLWISIVLFVIWQFKRKNFRFQISDFRFSRDRVFLFFILLFIIYSQLSILWSPEQDIALQQSVRVMEGFLVCIMLMSGPWRFRDLVPWFVSGAMISSVIGIVQFFTQSTFGSTILGMSRYMSDVSGVSVVASDTIGRWLRSYGTFPHPNIFGGYMVVAIIVWMIFMSEGGRGKRKVIYMSVVFILLLGLLFSFSRSALLAYFLFVSMYLGYAYYKKLYVVRWYMGISLVFLFIMGSMVFPLLNVRFGLDTSVSEVRSVSERSALIYDAWDIGVQHIWFGGGIGNYVFSMYEFDNTLSGWAYQPVHTIFLLLFVELGIIGLLLMGLIMVSLLWWLHGIIGKERQVWFFLCMGGLVYGVIGFFDHYLLSLYSGIMLSSMFFGFILLYMRDILHK